jgi:peptide/nickel transport system permease protein
MARVVRSKFLSLREEDFILAATPYGIPRGRLMVRQMIPSFLRYTIASITLSIPWMILARRRSVSWAWGCGSRR